MIKRVAMSTSDTWNMIQSSLEKWMIPDLGKEIWKSLEHVIMSETMEEIKHYWGHVKKKLRSQFEEALIGQNGTIWVNKSNYNGLEHTKYSILLHHRFSMTLK